MVAIGFFLDLTLRDYWPRESVPAPLEEHVPNRQVSCPVVSPAPRDPVLVSSSVDSESTLERKEPTVVASPSEPSVYGLTIDEANVSEMEGQMDDLRNYAYTVKTGDGWRVHLLPEDQVFLKAGVKILRVDPKH